jgi:hypothetical protein
MARNIWLVYKNFQAEEFYQSANNNLESKSLMERARHIANASL